MDSGNTYEKGVRTVAKLVLTAAIVFFHAKVEASFVCDSLFWPELQLETLPGTVISSERPRDLRSLSDMALLEHQAQIILRRNQVFNIGIEDQRRFFAELPAVKPADTEDLNGLLQNYLNDISSEQLVLTATPFISRGDARIFFVKNESGETELVIKIFAQGDIGNGLIHEISAGSVLNPLKSAYFGFVKIHDAFRLNVGGLPRVAMLMDAAPGLGFKDLLKKTASPQIIDDYMRAAAAGYAQFHLMKAKNVGVLSAHASRNYDVSRLQVYLNILDFEKLAETTGVGSSEGRRLKISLENIVKQIGTATFPYQSLVHGDGHIENVLVDGRKVWFIDYMSAEWGIQRENGSIEAKGDPLSDVGRFLESARLEALKQSLPIETINKIDQSFLSTYAGEWHIDPLQIRPVVDFYRIRFALVKLYDFGGLVKDDEKKLILEDLIARFTGNRQVEGAGLGPEKESSPTKIPAEIGVVKKFWLKFWH